MDYARYAAELRALNRESMGDSAWLEWYISRYAGAYRTVLIPAGTYRIDRPVHIRSVGPLNIDGRGARFSAEEGADVPAIFVVSPSEKP